MCDHVTSSLTLSAKNRKEKINQKESRNRKKIRKKLSLLLAILTPMF